MSYNNVTTEIAKATGLNEKLFQLDFQDLKPISEDSTIKRYSIRELQNHYISSYQYFENIKENWNCISIQIPLGILEEFIEILNPILANNGFEIVDNKKIPETFEYQNDGLNFLVGIKRDKYFQIDFAQKKYED